MSRQLPQVCLGAAIVCSLTGPAAAVTVWNSEADYSTVSNPNGAWSYDRKFSVAGLAADVMTIRWGTSGWYLGNVGNGGPSFYAGPHLWAKANGNGYPTLRWTAPLTGDYSIAGSFLGDDDRGVDNLVYVVINGTIAFSDHVTAYRDSKPFAFSSVHLSAGQPVDFVLTWNGAVNSEYGWTKASVLVSAVPEPISAATMAAGLLVLLAFRRRHRTGICPFA